ncbi:hypothetical protein LCGC14_1955830 [marine sediment metagenome]|uniref:Uncharacterized protein n=2 Tax=root TaxID=1 RepID=A0A831VMZ3_9FLAO|nr:hypothetical protein [Pricia antarctica]
MSTTKYYPTIWQTVPFSFDFSKWDSDGKCIKDMVLKNEFVDDLNVSEMNLNIAKFSAFDTLGKEHFITDFKGQDALTIKGIHAGDFLRSKSVLLLEPGTYTRLRFYLEYGSTFVYSDRVEEPADGFNHLDFEIENRLTIKGDESPEAILRFDFVPFKASKLVISIKQFFKRPRRVAGKLVESFSH